MSVFKRLSIALLVASALGALGLTVLKPYADEPGALAALIEQLANQSYTIWLLAAAGVICGFVIVPIAPVQISFGLIYGWTGIFYSLPTTYLAGVAGHQIGKLLGGEKISDKFEDGAVAKIIALIENHGTAASVLARWIPGIPFALQNLMLGATGVPLVGFVLGTTLGAGVVASLNIIVGTLGAQAITKAQDALKYGWYFPITCTAIAVLLWFSDRWTRSRQGGIA